MANQDYWDRNSGYVGHSMSKRAVEAYDNGEKPYTNWAKSEILDEIEKYTEPEELLQFKKWNLQQLRTLLSYSSWHHTSGAFNETKFYEISIKKIENAIENGFIAPKIEKTEKPKIEELYYHGEYKDVEYHPYSSHNKYNEKWIPFENARKKGDWILLDSGKKKKYSNVRNIVTTKTKRRKRLEQNNHDYNER